MDGPRPHLRILILEDRGEDEALLLHHLRKGGLEFSSERVATETDFTARLAQHWDVILADYNLPQFDAPSALRILAERGSDVPLLVVTGSVDEEVAVRMIKEGAADYLLKDRLSRLPEAVRNALEGKRLRDKKRRAERDLRESEGRYRSLFENNLAGVFRSTAGGKMLECNGALARILGFEDPVSLRGASTLQFFRTPEERASLLEKLTARGGLANVQLAVRRRDGSQRWVLANVTLAGPSSEAEPVIEGTLFDISERKRAEEALGNAQADLLKAKALETIGMIASGVAHEVRNPLFAITAVASALESKLKGQVEFGEYVAHIRDQASRLNALMSDLLTLGRPIEAADFRPTDLREIMTESLSYLEQGHAGVWERCRIEVGAEPPVVRGDRGRLVQVFVNLVQNALHFSPPDERVSLTAERAGGAVVCAVRDRGPGLPEDLLPRLFEPFQTRRKGGTGLGLAIVRKIVESHGGTVTAANCRPGPGAAFTVTLPLAPEG